MPANAIHGNFKHRSYFGSRQSNTSPAAAAVSQPFRIREFDASSNLNSEFLPSIPSDSLICEESRRFAKILLSVAMEEAQRWSVMYTKHVKQKRKVYHDGFLVLQSSNKKVMLYDEGDNLLDTRFVKKDDLIRSGETVTFDSHIVDLGELCRRHQPTSDVNSHEKSNKVSETSGSFYNYNSQNKRLMVGKSKRRVVNLISPSQKMIRDFKMSEMNKLGSSPKCMDMTELSTKGNTYEGSGTHTKLSDSSYKIENAEVTRGDAEPRRSVRDILSILRQPSERKVAPVNKPLSQDCVESHSSEFQSHTKNHIKEYSEECSGTASLGEKMSEHEGMIKVIKSEPVEIVDVEECEVSENEQASKTRSSSFLLRSQTAEFISPTHDVQSANLSKLMSSTSSVVSYAAVTASPSYGVQKEIVSEPPTRPYANEELNNSPIIRSCEDIMTETNAAPTNGLNEEDKNGISCRFKDECTEDMDEYPSFDLGIL